MKPRHIVVMGVAGCGKSAVGQRVATALHLPMIEGDDFHSSGSIEKMRRAVPLTDDDRAGWLQRLAQELAAHPAGAVLACSALKAAYREILRGASPGLRFVHLSLTPQQALERVGARSGHFYPASLVASQFEALEDPRGEPGVLAVDASPPLEDVVSQVLDGLRVAFNNA
jgi:gluconokinase